MIENIDWPSFGLGAGTAVLVYLLLRFGIFIFVWLDEA